ncbi:tetratricopeptide repeat protein [Chloroflexi bacterium TSY]|nr:tetratricopeptide repeat protein [Chloroflexi bacterium TSY]
MNAHASLGLLLLAQVRNTEDPAIYQQAQIVLEQALALDSKHIDALIGQGILALARHDFVDALDWAQKARQQNPFRSQILGIMVDAYVELGRYAEAIETAQEMVDLRPDLQSYSRVSYLRELHGDIDGAIEAMQAAIESGLPGSEEWLWSVAHLGDIYLDQDDWEMAERLYQAALDQRSGYHHAHGGIAQIQALRGQTKDAIESYQEIVENYPLPEFLVALGELYEATGEYAKAEEQYDLVRVVQKRNADAGMDVDLEMALFNADHGDPQLALEQARRTYLKRPTIFAADALAWALYQNGEYEEANQYSQEALRLGTKTAILHDHAEVISESLSASTSGAVAESINRTR